MTQAAPAPARELGQVRQVVAAARGRMKVQAALEGATTASIVASASALATVFGVRTEVLAPGVGIGLLAACGGVVVAGAVLGALRKLDDEEVARRIDRASGLADRLSTAIAFDRVLSQPPGTAPTTEPGDTETVELMHAAMRDAARVASLGRANVQAATPFVRPADLPAALGFAVVAAIAAGIGIDLPDRDPLVARAAPAAARRGAEVTIVGERLCGPEAKPDLPCKLDGATVYLGADLPTSVSAWTGGGITLTVPMTAPYGKTQLVVYSRGKKIGAAKFEVLRDDDPRNFTNETVVLAADDEAYMRELAADLKQTGERDQVPELSEYAAKIEELLDKASKGELTKEELLAEMKKAEAALLDDQEPDQKQIDKDLNETGLELSKHDLTKELGKALAENDLEKAEKELEKLAEKLDKNELTEQQQQELAKAMEQAAKQYEQKAQERQQKDQSKVAQAEEAVRKLEKERDESKTPEEREENERRLEKKQRELDELKKKQEEREQSAQRRSLKRLHKDMEKAAKQLQKKDQPQDGQEDKPQDGQQNGEQKDGQQDGQQEQSGQKQASRTLKDIASETGKVDRDQRKQAAQKKVSSQMEDLKEAMRRAKQRGSQGPQNPFGKNNQGQGKQLGKGQGQGQGQGKQPGQGQGQGQQPGQQGQGQGQPGGQGQGDPQNPSNTYGDGHDPNLVGDATGKSGDTKDESVSGVHGKKGPSRRETILSAAQKGFASTAYKDVYADYKKVVEDVMRTEKVPSSYRYYVKKYFTKIKPHSMD